MSNHIAVVQLDDLDALDVLEDIHRLQQAALLVMRQVHLRQVARDDELGVATHTGEEHLELSRGGVLRLVKDDEGVVQRAAAHESQRGNLDGVVLPVGEQLLLRYHVAQRVVERLQVGVKLVAQVAGQEA